MASFAPPPDRTSRILRHERLIAACGIAILIALSWGFLIAGAGMDSSMDMAAMQPPFGAMVLMWWLMMVAMMLPSAAPAILLYGRVRWMRGEDPAVAPTWIFMSAYLGIWLLFSLVAALAQLLFAGPAIAIRDPDVASGLLILAGLYQLSPLKGACLRQCRSPAQFISRHWTPGVSGALRLGMLHGAYCVGCCWILMALLFVGGVMNFVWIAALTALVGIEKLAPGGRIFGLVAGAALIAWGAARIAA